MMSDRRPAPRCSRHSRLAIVACAVTAISACASGVSVDDVPARHVAEVAQADIPEPARLNLLARGQTPADSRVKTMQLGNGSYLCTPAGFGQGSWCRRN